jgi:biotin carboxylase
VVLVAPPKSYRTAAYAAAVRRRGRAPLVVSEGPRGLAVEGGIHLPLGSDEAPGLLLTALAGREVRGLVATDDATVELASRVAAALGLPHNPPTAARISRRKDLSRQALGRAGVPAPASRRLHLARDLPAAAAALRYPCVVKPLALSGSRGVIRADDPWQLLDACRRIDAILAAEGARGDEGEQVLVEDYVEGFEVALEGMLRGGALTMLALFDKPEPLTGPYFEESYYVTPSRLPGAVQARISARVAQACAAYGLREGPVHAELRVGPEEIWVIEVASRTIGGECARLLRFGAGEGLEDLVVAHAAGEAVEPRPMTGGAGVLMIPIPRAGILRRVEGVLDAMRVPGVEDVVISVREGYEVVPPPEGSAYLGFIYARAGDPAAAEAALRAAHACLRIVTAPVLGRQAVATSSPQEA